MGGNGDANAYGEVRIDPRTIRGLAEKIHMENKLNVTPQVDEIRALFSGGSGPDADVSTGTDGKSQGYLFGASGIMEAHQRYLTAGAEVLEHFKRGLQALANAAACAAEDHATLDEQNAMTSAQILAYFTPQVDSPTVHKYVDPDTGAWSYYGPPDAGSGNAPTPK